MPALKEIRWGFRGIGLKLLAFAAMAWLWCLFLVAASDADPLEYKVKAGYLFNFAKFIEWPSSSLPATNSPIVIGVLDANEALPVIREVLEGKIINGHPIQVKSLAGTNAKTDCQILFVSRAAAKTPASLRTVIGDSPTLLVGETERFAEHGGMIGFVFEAESFRLKLNLDAATEAGLKISAKLSKVARLVKADPR